MSRRGSPPLGAGRVRARRAGAVLLVFFIANVYWVSAGQAQEALVLSGGGSRGLAHAGALVGLEQLGRDADIVVGTSMGAVVGALYAAGYPPAEIEDRIRAVDWGEMFTPAPLVLGPGREVRYPLLSFDRQTDPLRFSRGFIPQWRINRVLVHLLFDANTRSRGNFDRLARRFRAVATDLKTGDTVVLARGDLARAARASMAVPGIFAPVEWEGRVLVDGGIASNRPTSVARELGSRRVTVVDVSRPPKEIQGRGPVQVLERALDLLEENAEKDTIPPDILIIPDIPPTTSGLIFPADPGALFELGRAAAMRDVRPATGERPEARTLPPPPAFFGDLVIEAPDRAVEAVARRVFAPIVPGPYDPRRILSGVDRLYTTGLFEGVWPRVEERGGTSPTLVLRLETPPRFSVSGAAGYDTDRGGRVWGAAQRYTTLHDAPVVLTGSASLDRLREWADASVRIFSPRLLPLVQSVGLFGQDTDVRRFDAEPPLQHQEVRRFGAYWGLELPQLLHARVAFLTLRAEQVTVEDGERGLTAGPLLRLAAPQPKPPIVGTENDLEAEERWGVFAYRRAAFRFSRERKLSALRMAVVAAGAAASAGAPPDIVPALGDENAFPGFRWGEGRGRTIALAGLDAAYPVLWAGYLRARLRAGAVGNRPGPRGGVGQVEGVDVSAMWRAPFGVLSLAIGRNTNGRGTVVLDIGSQF